MEPEVPLCGEQVVCARISFGNKRVSATSHLSSLLRVMVKKGAEKKGMLLSLPLLVLFFFLHKGRMNAEEAVDQFASLPL